MRWVFRPSCQWQLIIVIFWGETAHSDSIQLSYFSLRETWNDLTERSKCRSTEAAVLDTIWVPVWFDIMFPLSVLMEPQLEMVTNLFFFIHHKRKAHYPTIYLFIFLIFNYSVTFTNAGVFPWQDIRCASSKGKSPIFLIKVVLFFYCSYLRNGELPVRRLHPILSTVVQTE